jgi:pimeloyl-ACP methyl ester carboxylesterase
MPDPERVRNAIPDDDGTPSYAWVLSNADKTDLVKLVAKPCILPVIFVPGIMGSNLRNKATGKSVWRLNATFGQPLGLLWSVSTMGPGERQQALNPDLVEVDPNGDVPGAVASIGDKAAILKRGWGGVGETSYKAFLMWLEQHLNQVSPNPALWTDFYQDEATIGPMPTPGAQPRLSPGVKMGINGQPFAAELPFQALKTDDLLARSRFNMPVHAFGYNWLGSCKDAAKLLQTCVDDVIKQYDRDPFWCQQVVLVTHSMGGLVARSCAKLPGMADKIAGVVHGVMPAIGAAVAYRRCKVGMADEDYAAGLVIGSNGMEVTAVFAQAPGALQLLPSKDYAPKWLRVEQSGKPAQAWPATDPYAEIYSQRDVWWGLVSEAWLSPASGSPISWTTFLKNVDKAEAFHGSIAGKYHACSHVFYGADPEQQSFEKVTWRVKAGMAPDSKPRPGLDQIVALKANQIRNDGSATAYVGGSTEVTSGDYPVVYETSYWELHCETHDGSGDGTVPASSGQSPRLVGGAAILQQFGLKGFAHEPAYKNGNAQKATLYAITRIAATAKKP